MSLEAFFICFGVWFLEDQHRALTGAKSVENEVFTFVHVKYGLFYSFSSYSILICATQNFSEAFQSGRERDIFYIQQTMSQRSQKNVFWSDLVQNFDLAMWPCYSERLHY